MDPSNISVTLSSGGSNSDDNRGSSMHTSTDDDVIIMDGVLVDNGPSSPSRARRSVSFVDNNGPSNRRSVSIRDLVLVSSGSQGAIGTGSSGGRRSGSSGQVIVCLALMISSH